MDCVRSGVYANDCKIHAHNMIVRANGGSGVLASSAASDSGGIIKLSSSNTKIESNCIGTKRYQLQNRALGDFDYGLDVDGASSKIQIVSPLTKETISINNGGGTGVVVMVAPLSKSTTRATCSKKLFIKKKTRRRRRINWPNLLRLGVCTCVYRCLIKK